MSWQAPDQNFMAGMDRSSTPLVAAMAAPPATPQPFSQPGVMETPHAAPETAAQLAARIVHRPKIIRGGGFVEFRAAGTAEPSASEVLHAEMLRRIAVLEDAMAKLPAQHGGIGHNNPPAPIEIVPFGESDRRAIQNAIAALNAQRVEPALPAKAREAAAQIKTIGERIAAYAAKQSDEFVSATVKAAGAEAGKRIVQLAFWAVLAKALLDVAKAVTDWLASLNIPF
jgi:hypothetical protein